MVKPEEYMRIYGGTGMANLVHSIDAQMINNQPQELKQSDESHHPVIRQCMHCGKKGGGHYIMCTAWID